MHGRTTCRESGPVRESEQPRQRPVLSGSDRNPRRTGEHAVAAGPIRLQRGGESGEDYPAAAGASAMDSLAANSATFAMMRLLMPEPDGG